MDTYKPRGLIELDGDLIPNKDVLDIIEKHYIETNGKSAAIGLFLDGYKKIVKAKGYIQIDGLKRDLEMISKKFLQNAAGEREFMQGEKKYNSMINDAKNRISDIIKKRGKLV